MTYVGMCKIHPSKTTASHKAPMTNLLTSRKYLQMYAKGTMTSFSKVAIIRASLRANG